ncbi:hypothetical protein [Methylomicrobium sp. Wu6]|uniref:hypothetical protein n=1 Tax=Methylomicrobium sp. Wu6 TaxID=3107928 RepID=UPI002DD623E1|nr:hypothetical protein [Methylomicrobium sp. Wu6]MEC4749220.1 hypothetical protein [Methylomicrobium sp. Wu6]
MNAFAVRITYADSSRLGWNASAHYEKHELFVGASSRYVHALDAAHLDTHELATQFRDAIVAREHGKGHLDFEAEVEEVWSSRQGFSDSIEKDSKAVHAYLEKHGYPKPGADPASLVRSGWVIQLHIDKPPPVCYLLSLVNTRLDFTTELGRAKCYKTEANAQKVLAKLNAGGKTVAVAVPIEQAS